MLYALVAGIIILQSLALLYVQMEYGINHAYIAKVLCVNRDKPQMHCDGKCFLKKDISRAAEQQDQKNTSSFSVFNLFFEQPFYYHIYPAIQQPVKDFFASYFSPGFLIPSEHPPTCS